MPALLVFVVAFGAYAWTAAPAAGWLDSPEFVAAASSLGVAHSPGHPLPVLLGRAAQLIPLGDADLRVALASGVAVAAAAALVVVVVERIAARVAAAAAPGVRAAVAAASGLAFAASGAAWLQAVRAEVYGAEIVLVALALAFVVTERRSARSLAAAGLALGLGLANHHYMTVVAALPLAAWILGGRPSARALAAAVAGTALGLAAYAYLPLRAARDPLVDWGDPDTPARFVWTVSARAFQKSLAAEQHALDSRGADALQVLAALVEQLSPLGFFCALLGAYVLLRRRDARPLALALAGVAATTAAGRALLGFDFGNPDALGYLLPAVLAAIVLAGAGLLALAATPALRRVGPVLAALTAVTVAWQLAAHAAASSRRHAESGDAFAHALVETLPPRALVVTSYFETAFATWELAAVEQLRPDVGFYDRSFATYPGFAAHAVRRDPALAPLVDAGLAVGRPAPLAALDAFARTRPVFFELALTLDPPLAARLDGDGVLGRYRSATGWSSPDDAAMRALERRVPLDDDARRVLLWHEYIRARFHCDAGRPALAAPALARALRLAPTDAALVELAATCRSATAGPSRPDPASAPPAP